MTAGRIIVVGGGGFIGSRVLRVAGMRGLDAVSVGPDTPGGLPAVLGASGAAAVIWAAGFNPAGEGLARTATAAPGRAVAVNAGDFTSVLAGCAAAGVRRVVQCGSTVVYGPPALYGPGRVDESARPAPRTAYGLSKRMAELAADWGRDALGLSVTTLRLPLVLGPGRWYAGAAASYARLLQAAANGGTAHEAVPGHPFDAAHGDDVADALLLLAALDDAPALLNMAGSTLTMPEVAAALARLAPAARLEVTETAAQPDLPLVNDARLRALGWSARRDLRTILADTLREMTAKETA